MGQNPLTLLLSRTTGLTDEKKPLPIAENPVVYLPHPPTPKKTPALRILHTLIH